MITKHLVKNHPRSRWKLIKDSGDFTSMKAKAIAKGKSAKVVGIVFGDDEKAANPSCMTFDEFILKNTKTLRRTSTSTSTSPSLIIINNMFMIIMIIVIVKATHGRGVPHEASEARPVNVLMGERCALAPRQRRDERAACPRVNVLLGGAL